ncbi:MAG: hypothetical protein QXZ69_00210 [Candidatus Micrarchaeia archaeon]
MKSMKIKTESNPSTHLKKGEFADKLETNEILKKKSSDEINKKRVQFNNLLDEFIKKKSIGQIISLVEKASEDEHPIRDKEFYAKAVSYVRTLSPFYYYPQMESIGLSTAIACVRDEDIYYSIIDYLLKPMAQESSLGDSLLKKENLDSACRVLASIAISNEKLEKENNSVISVPSAFVLAIDRLLEFEIEKERRVEEKADRLVEVYEQALAAKIDSDTGRELYEKVFNYIMDNEKLSLDYKMKTIFEITRRAIKHPGLSHTKLFMKTIEFYKENKVPNISRALIQLLFTNKK